jgi:hypothetical protein
VINAVPGAIMKSQRVSCEEFQVLSGAQKGLGTGAGGMDVRATHSNRQDLVIAVVVILSIWAIVLHFADRPMPIQYQHAAEASLLEGESKPEGHGK